VGTIRLSRVKLRWHWANLAVRLGIVSVLLAVPVLLAPRIAAGQDLNQDKMAVVFYAEPKVEASVWPSLADAFHAEILREESEYPLPEDVALIRGSSFSKGEEFAGVIEVRLIGRCDVVQQAERVLPPGPLGWVVDVSGEIQPFVFVDCARLAQFLNPTTLGMNDEQRKDAMARAISRVVIHEWIHIDGQTARHTSRGLRKAELTGTELTGGSAGGR